ncbi:MAG TPA: zinc ribbon domain-containing protein, partial [Pyrinomonadaceae bacterium]
MPAVPAPQDRSRCPICRAALVPGALVCPNCGARLDEAAAQEELRAVIYLLTELKDWETKGLMAEAEAAALRRRYELRRDELRAHVASNGDQPQATTHGKAASTADIPRMETQAAVSSTPRRKRLFFTSRRKRDARTALASDRSRRNAADKARTALPFAAARAAEQRRPLFETLADPHTLRLLLYTGAAMLVVGIVIWLRDVLYLKLQEPLVQAVLLACGTVAVMLFGWLMTLGTRLRLTGRALTLIGSLLVPVNFWFLVRSGLISNNGRAWMVCALCAVLYTLTAALVRERLYVYLACAASVATLWALVFRTTPEAYGLYALTLMTASLVFLHLSRLFVPVAEQQETQAAPAGTDARAEDARADIDETAHLSRWSYALWGPPLVRTALAGAAASALLYMLLRLGPSHSLSDGLFRLSASSFDASIAMLLFAASSYIAWFAARYIYPESRTALYTISALSLFWTEFLLLDGLRLQGTVYLFAFSVTASATSFAAPYIAEEVLVRALHRATDIVFTLLLLTASVVALFNYLAVDEVQSWRPAILFTLVVITLSGAGRGRREHSAYGAGLSSLAALILVAASLDALMAAGLFPSSWPIAGGVVCAAFLLQWASTRWLVMSGEEAKDDSRLRGAPNAFGRLDTVIRMIADFAVTGCALLWFTLTISLTYEVGWGAPCVLGLALLYWIERAVGQRRAQFAHLSSIHAGAFLLALLIALRCEGRWLAAHFTLLLFPLLFALSRYARAHAIDWLAMATSLDAQVLTALVSLAALIQAAPLLQTGNESLLAPTVTAGAISVVTFSASLFSVGGERVLYFRVGLCAAVAAFVLAALRAGFDPLIDVELYTSPIAVLLLIVAYLAVRREWDEYASDANLLLWTGALLLCGPLLIRALQFRLLLDLPAPLRDVGVLCVSLLVIFFGVLGRLRAPVMVGAVTLSLELAALALTSVEWLQVPLKIYLIT